MRWLVILLLPWLLTDPAMAQSQWPAVPSLSFAADTALDCDGRIAGRWRLYFDDPLVFCTIEVKRGGKVRPQDGARTECRGPRIGEAAVLGGRLHLEAPLANQHGSSNQCWVHGAIRTEVGQLEVVEAFIAKGSGLFSGVGLAIGFPTRVTGVRY